MLRLLLTLLLLPGSCFALTNGLVLTPIMGWSPWNAYQNTYTATTLSNATDMLTTNGMKAVGYNYILIDDGWMQGRDAVGNLIVNSNMFPNGVKPVADYVHSKGFKFGMYAVCTDYPTPGLQVGQTNGSPPYETNDANVWASWGVDHLKYDSFFVSDAARRGTNMMKALAQCGRPISFGLSGGYWDTWKSSVANMFRVGNDLQDTWSATTNNLIQGYSSGPAQINDAGPGRWNDLDMLYINNNGLHGFGSGMTTTEYQASFSMWCMSASPIIAGTYLTNLDATALGIYTNTELIAIDQDPYGKQGSPIVSVSPGLEVWTKPLSGGGMAVALFNRTASASPITANWSDVYNLPGALVSVRDCWAHANLGTFPCCYTTTVQSHSAVILTTTLVSLGYSINGHAITNIVKAP